MQTDFIVFGWPQVILLIALYGVAEWFKLAREREVKRELAETKKELSEAARAGASQLSDVQKTVERTDHRANSREQIHLELVVDLYEEILAANPESATAKAKLTAARQRLADHIAEEDLMRKRRV